jgi:predicted Zn-dependent protease
MPCKRFGLLLILFGLALGPASCGCKITAPNPDGGDSKPSPIFVDFVGESTAAEVVPADRTLLDEVSRRLLAVLDPLPDYVRPVRFEIVNDNQVKAYATASVEGKGKDAKLLPRVVVHQGLLDGVINSRQDPDGKGDRLAFILGHELGHVVLAHIVRPPTGETRFIQQAFTRQQEADADRKGMELALKAGYSFRRSRSALDRFKQLGLSYSSFEGLGTDHPSWNDRLALLDREQAGLWRAMSAFENGTFFLLFEQYPAAEGCFREVSKEFPQCYEAWTNLGDALLMQYCDKLDADDLRAFAISHLVVGGFYRRPGSLEAMVRGVDKTLWNNAVQALQKALTLQPNLVLAKADLGLAYLVSPYGQDVEQATRYLREAVEQSAADRRLDPLMRAGVWINCGVADLAAGRAEEALRKFDHGAEIARRSAGTLPQTPVTWAVSCALLYNRASLLAASAEPSKRAAAVNEYEAYLRNANPACTWWPVAYGRYAKLCQDLGIPAKPQTALANPRLALFRFVSSLKLRSGTTVTLSEPVSGVVTRLGAGQRVPVARGTNLVRLRYPEHGIELLCSNQVLAIWLRGSAAPALPLQGLGPAGQVETLRLGMAKQELDDILRNQTSDLQQIERADVSYTFYPNLGLAVRVQNDKLEEVVVAQVPRRAPPDRK